jgi:RNA 2'-phosphotransferase, Tpt1 / KptA family
MSRKLTYILRHNAIKQGINMRKDGYVKVSELVSLKLYYCRSVLSLRATAGPSHISFARLYDSGTYSSQGQQEAVYPVK